MSNIFRKETQSMMDRDYSYRNGILRCKDCGRYFKKQTDNREICMWCMKLNKKSRKYSWEKI